MKKNTSIYPHFLAAVSDSELPASGDSSAATEPSLKDGDYYSNRKQEMIIMRDEGGKTYREIAEYYNVSNARVQQIIGKITKTRKEWTLEQINKTDISPLTRKEILQRPGIKEVWEKECGKKRHAASGGAIKTAMLWEEKAANTLRRHGFSCKLMPISCPFDILVCNQIKINVKSPSVPQFSPSQKFISNTYNISNLDGGKNCDFFFFLIPNRTKRDILIVPALEFENQEYTKLSWPYISQKKRGKYTPYLNNFELIRAKLAAMG